MPIISQTSPSFLKILPLVVVAAMTNGLPTVAADIFQLDHFLSELLYTDASYSAQRTQLVGGEPLTTATIAYSSGKERQELFYEDMDMSVLGITRSDQGIVYLKSNSTKMPSLDQETRTSFDDLPGATGIEKTKVGAETVKDLSTTKFEIAATLENGAKVAGYMWLQKDGIPVKVDLKVSLDNLIMPYHIEQSNIQVVEHPDELFAIPGY